MAGTLLVFADQGMTASLTQSVSSAGRVLQMGEATLAVQFLLWH